MTSWIRGPAPKRAELKTSLFFETSSAGFCTNFNQLLYAYAYSVSEGKPLNVYDLSNPIAPTYPLIKNTFEDISGIVCTDGVTAGSMSINRVLPRVMANARSIPIETLRRHAQQIFKWKESFIPTLKTVLSSTTLPGEFDLGIHIRVGDRIASRDRRVAPVDEYIRVAKKYQTDSKKDKLSIFLMSDSIVAISEFKKKAPASWSVYTLPPSLTSPDGHLQSQFNRSPAPARMNAYRTFMAELLIMQSISSIICTFSSNVGRFLYMTVESPEKMISIDERFEIK